MTPGSAIFKLAYELSPIVLVGGIAQKIPGGMLPIIMITEAASFVQGILSGASNINLDDFFAHFAPMPGSTLIDFSVGKYPLANQAVAANAVIANPLTLSMLMTCPARGDLGYVVKLVTMTALQATLNYHISNGGTFIVVTPASFYTNGLLLSMRDVTAGQSKQVQAAYQLDFEFPLLTLNQAQSVQNSLMSKLTGGTQIDGQPAWSGLSSSVAAPNSLATPGVLPSAASLPAVGTSPNLGALPGVGTSST